MSELRFTEKSTLSPSLHSDLNTYIAHSVHGKSLRSLAKQNGVHPSTILRRVRKLEQRRDDPLVDEAIDALSRPQPKQSNRCRGDILTDCRELIATQSGTNAKQSNKDFIRFLKNLDENGAFLALAADMENALIMRELDCGDIVRTAVIGRSEAQLLALNDWVEVTQTGRVSRYKITNAGRMALKRMIAAQTDPTGMAEAPNIFGEQHKDWGIRIIAGEDRSDPRPQKVNLADSPLTLLSRRKGKDGKSFLCPDLVTAGERLREDFELSQMDSGVTQNWEKILTGHIDGGPQDRGYTGGAAKALNRFQSAMKALGPGLSEIALYCCCMQQGMEIAEKRLGWSARSGKIVLRIALQRLRQHYDEQHGTHGPLIG